MRLVLNNSDLVELLQAWYMGRPALGIPLGVAQVCNPWRPARLKKTIFLTACTVLE